MRREEDWAQENSDSSNLPKKKTIHIPENFGLKGYTLVRLGVKDLSKFIQFDQQ